MKICIIGGGWYGCHLANALNASGYEVTIIEKNADIFMGISGSFGIRLHAGPHYPRSDKTRESCQRTFNKFITEYKPLIVEHEHSFYALGKSDSFNLPPKVDLAKFKSVCEETRLNASTETPIEWGYQNLQYVADVYEPSVAVGDKVRDHFKSILSAQQIKTLLNTKVTKVTKVSEKTRVESEGKFIGEFDTVISTTSYQSQELLPKDVKFPFEPKYQVCLGLFYIDKNHNDKKPFSFIVMDGLFPCMMPYVGETETALNNIHKYIMTHGEWTILGTFDKQDDAALLLNSLTADDINLIRTNCEKYMTEVWPEFKDRFEFDSWKGTVLVKLFTDVEFRSAVTYTDAKNIIHVIPGKVSNIFDVEDEVLKLVERNEAEMIHKEGFSYIKGGVLDDAMSEIVERPPVDDKRNTCHVQTYKEFKPDFRHEVSDQNSAAPPIQKNEFNKMLNATL